MLNGILKCHCLFLCQGFCRARFFVGRAKLEIVSRMTERMAAETFSQGMPLELIETALCIVWMVFRVRSTIGKFVVFVRLLGIGVRADLHITAQTAVGRHITCIVCTYRLVQVLRYSADHGHTHTPCWPTAQCARLSCTDASPCRPTRCLLLRIRVVLPLVTVETFWRIQAWKCCNVDGRGTTERAAAVARGCVMRFLAVTTQTNGHLRTRVASYDFQSDVTRRYQLL